MINLLKVRLYPHREQAVSLAKAFGCDSLLGNNSLVLINRLDQENGKGLTRDEIQVRLPQLKKKHPWLKEAYSQLFQSVYLNLSQAFINFWEMRSRYPKFKSKYGKKSIHYRGHNKLENDKINLPKICWVKTKTHTSLHALFL